MGALSGNFKKSRSLDFARDDNFLMSGDGFQPSRKCVLKGYRSAKALRHSKALAERCSAWTDRSVRPHTGKSKVIGGGQECPAHTGDPRNSTVGRVVVK